MYLNMNNQNKINLSVPQVKPAIICSIIISYCSQIYADHINHSHIESRITDITNFKEIESTVTMDQNTLVLVDIDDTIFSSTTYYGSVDFFKNTVRNNSISKKIPHEESLIDIYPRWLLSQNIIETQLTDQYIHKFLNYKKEATILGFTARQPVASDITLSQLKKHKINFNQPNNLQFTKNYGNIRQGSKRIWSYDYKIATLRNGIVFCHDLNPKGKVFNDLIIKLNQFRKNQNQLPISKVIFIDDSRNNLESVKIAANKIGLNFYGYHFHKKTDSR